MSSTTEQIKERLSIVDVVGGYLKLERSGANMKARCPFHNEKTPSFYVSPGRGTYHCFGCNRGGDVFSFVEEIEGLDFPGALKLLAERAGVELRPDDHRLRGERERLLAAMESATRFYQSELEKNPAALEYLTGRGLTDTTIAQFRVGFAKDDWRTLYDHLRSQKFSDQEMERAGLVIFREGKKYDRFRSRIMFPIADASGRPVAFSGRIFGKEDDSAKYVNSPETPLYNKSKILYAYDQAKMDIRKSDSCVIVEGQMDVIMSHQAGIANTVAASGTALTPEHLEQIGRMTENLVLAFDADDAGLKAAGRGIDLALARGFSVRVVGIEGGKDPADLVKSDPRAWRDAVASAKHVIDFMLEAALKRSRDDRMLRINIEQMVIPLIARMKNPVDQSTFVGKVAMALKLPNEGATAVWESIKRVQATAGIATTSHVADVARSLTEARPEDRYIEKIENNIIGIVLWQKKNAEPAIDVAEIEARFDRIAAREFARAAGRFPPEIQDSLIFQAEMQYGGREALARDLAELLSNYEEHTLKRRLVGAMAELKAAEARGDPEAVTVHLALCQTISREINLLVSKRST